MTFAGPKNLRSWLCKAPRPLTIQCDEKIIDAPKTARGWTELAGTIKELEPNKIVLMEGTKLLRAQPFDAFYPDEGDGDEGDRETDSDRLIVLSQLLAEAYTNAGKNFEPIGKHLADLVSHQATQLAKVTADNDRLKHENLKLKAELQQVEIELENKPEGEDGLGAAIMTGLKAAQAAQGEVTPIKKGGKS